MNSLRDETCGVFIAANWRAGARLSIVPRLYLPKNAPILSENMKNSYELAMERLNKSSPAVKLTEKQKKALAELDSIYAARIAERELAAQGDVEKAVSAGDDDAADKARQQLIVEKQKIREELETKKDRVRKGGA